MRDELLSGFQHELDGMAQTGGSRDSAETRPDMTPADDALLRALRALIAALETLGRPVLPLEVQP